MKLLIIVALLIYTSIAGSLVILTPKAPPAIPLIKAAENCDGVSIQFYQDVMTEVIPKIMKNENFCYILPVNVAAKLHNKGRKLNLLGITSGGLLYLISSKNSGNGIADLDNKKVYIGAPGSSPDVISRSLFSYNKVTPEIIYLTSQEIAKMLIRKKIDYAVLPEPLASFALYKNSELHRSADFKEEWKKLDSNSTLIPQVGLFSALGNKKENKELIDKFLISYKNAVSWCQENPHEAAILGKNKLNFTFPVEVLTRSLSKMNLIFMEAEEGRDAIDLYLNKLKQINPKIIGGKLPDDSFYQK